MINLPKIDLYPLSLLRLVAKHRGFTAASKEAGITQSALTRQVQALESQVGTLLLDRTTRSVTITEAGAILLRETEALPHILEGAMRRIQEEVLDGSREIRIGLSTSLSQAHIPGIFHGNPETQTGVRMLVSQGKDQEIIQEVAASSLDLGIVVAGDEKPNAVDITHEMSDGFCAITATHQKIPDTKSFRAWAKTQNWLLPPSGSTTRQLIERWAERERINIAHTMELENFDLMNQFASMGMGSALVPMRSLSIMLRKDRVHKLKLPVPLHRTLAVIVPKHGRTPEHVSDFVSRILFS